MRIWSRQFVLNVAVGSNLREAIQGRTQVLGGPPMPPAWVLFPWIDSVRGQNNAQAVVAQLRDAAIPASALWIEDWMGSWENDRRFWMRPLRHQVDATLYPDLRDLADHLHAQGFKLLGYFCPEIAADTPLYREAWEQGHLVCDSHKIPVDVVILGNHHGEPDLTQPKTRHWIQARWFAPLEQVGFDGWMADFGEYLPVDSVLADGTNGYESHNRYPLLWQSLHREFWERVRPTGDYTFFVRSASLGSAHVAPVMWGGDSDTDWDAADGLATVVPQALSAGILGHALWGTDIAGYMTFGLTRPSTKELYFRWTQLAALLPIMRTHHGTARPRNWNWQRDQHTLQHFARYARLHALLFPYFYTLAYEAHQTGLPIVRPLFLEFDEERYYSVNDVFMLGQALLVAPVVKPGHRSRLVPFPPGTWTDWWTGLRFAGPATIRVPAALEYIPLFVRDGTLLALQEGPLNRHGQPPGFVQTAAGEPAYTQLTSQVTILTCGTPSPADTHVALPNGLLHVTADRTANSSSAATNPVLAPRTADHAPLLDTSGQCFVVRPGRTIHVGGLIWHWNGPTPLKITLRQLSER
jgi:alpha-glucosidase (family GH31 glycosyl hydrolase)